MANWSEEIVEFAPYCLRRNKVRPDEGLLLEVIDDRYDMDSRTQIVKLKVVKTGRVIERPFSWVKEECEKLNPLEVLAWQA